MRENILQKEKGITLIALVITVIVLIILAGVTITMVVGDNGIITKAKEAKQNTTNAYDEEKEQLKQAQNEFNQLLEEGQASTTPDTEGPNIEIELKENGGDYVEIFVNANDVSGLAEQDTYQYYKNDEFITNSNSNTYKYENLTELTEYTFKVIVTDKNGNTNEKELKVTTIKKLPANIQELQEGDYVAYKDGNNSLKKGIILYGAQNQNYATYGIQIITEGNVKDLYYGNNSTNQLKDDMTAFNTAKEVYNTIVTKLNSEAEIYRLSQNNAMLKSARCVGSVPNNPSYESGMIADTYGYLSRFGQFKDKDDNYVSDIKQLEKLVTDGKLENIGQRYWLASRYTWPLDGSTVFRVRCISNSGSLDDTNMCYVYNTGGVYSYNDTKGLRVVFTLDESLDIKITSGTGEKETPYILE